MAQKGSPAKTRSIAPLRDFLESESAGGAVLLVGTLVALIWANSPLRDSYFDLWNSHLSIHVGELHLDLSLRHWVNDALMTIFFFVVGLEIKRETTSGHLVGREKIMLPLFGALGGMVAPALLYMVIAGSVASRGWGVPMATDIALAVGLLSTLGKTVPGNLRSYLLGLAVVDDIAAILVIAIFYSSGVSGGWLTIALMAIVVTFVLQRMNMQFIPAYVICGVILWFALHEAGVHATIAGVIMGLLTPLIPKRGTSLTDSEEDNHPNSPGSVSVLEWLEHLLHPWSAFVIVPLFALANAGVEMGSDSIQDALTSRIAWGIFAGLVLGKPIGVFLASVFAQQIKVAQLPTGATRSQILGIGQTAGIGFTVAIFISELAFTSEQHRTEAKIAILFASLTAALLGVAILKLQKGNRS